MAFILGFSRDQLVSAYRRRGSVNRLRLFAGVFARPAADALPDHSLSALVEREIIPRLVASHSRPGQIHMPLNETTEISAADVDTFAPLTLQIEADSLLDYVEAMLDRGISADTLLVNLLAPAARRLGEYWEDDRCDFVDVTMGLWRLQEVVHELSSRLPSEHQSSPGKRVIFASLQGDQHSFGAVVIDELFCRDGWLTDRMSEASTPDLLARVAGEWIDLVGLTISCDYHMPQLPSIIVALRNVSRNPRLCVMVGGRIFSESPELAESVGADGTAPDAKIALKVAAQLVGAVAVGVAAFG